jgi:hypothetical protein
MMHRSSFVATVAATILFQIDARAAVVAQSTFVANNDNWTVTFGANNSGSATFNAADGVPAGSLRSTDRPDLNATWYFQSSNVPGTTFYGDMSAAYGIRLTYDLKRFTDPGAEYYTESGATVYTVRLNGLVDADMNGSLETSMTLGFSSPSLTPTTTGEWKHFSVPLVASAGWYRDFPVSTDVPATESQMMAVLLNLRQIEIRGNYSLPIGDSTGLDNVTLVPEPAGCAIAFLLAVTLSGIDRRRLRHNRRFRA